MRTPSLQRRVVAFGVVTVGVVVLALSAIVHVALAASLQQTIEDALVLRTTAAFNAARATPDVDGLAESLSELGIPAIVVGPSGDATSAPVVRSRPGEDLILSTDLNAVVSRTIDVSGGRRVTVLVNRSGADETLGRLLYLEGLAAIVALLSSYLLLHRGTAAALSPLDEVVAAAQRTAEGHTGQRLDPDDPTSELGRLAVSFDHMLDELESALEEARDAEERGRRFLADAAHQLRTPLASIRAGVELLLIEPDPRRRDEHLGQLLRETTRGTKVLNSLLTLARLDRGRHLDREPADPADICRNEVERALSLAPDLAVDLHDERAEPGEILVDVHGFREAVANLLDNARRHAGGQITVTVLQEAARTAVVVWDDGPGIPPEARELVFERFATIDGKGGSGLGLPIARAVAREHGGDLLYDGTAFVLTLIDEAGPARAG